MQKDPQGVHRVRGHWKNVLTIGWGDWMPRCLKQKRGMRDACPLRSCEALNVEAHFSML
jgi:hypothetical protein